MKVRTQLVLVFLLFTILPLSALTLYSYYSSSRAFRELVEDETVALAQDMRARMQQVTEELSRGMEHFDHAAFSRMMAAKAEPGAPDATKIYSSLVSGMGASAGMLDSIEFCPPAPPPTPKPVSSAPRPDLALATGQGKARGQGISEPKKEAEPKAPTVSGMVIPTVPEALVVVMPELEQLQANIESAAHSVVINKENNRIVLQGPMKIDLEKLNSELAKAGEMPWGPAQAEQIKRAVENATRTAEETTRKSGSLAKEIQAMEQARATWEKRRKTWLAKSEPEGDTIGVRLGRAPRRADRRPPPSGEVIAHMKTKEMVRRVLRRDGVRPADVVFALDQTGRLHTPDPNNRGRLEKVGIKAGPAANLKTAKFPEDWIVATVDESGSGMTFGIARPIGDSLKEIRNTFLRNLGFGLGFIGVALLGIFPLSKRITRDLGILTAGVEKLSSGDLNARVPVNSKDEFGTLASAFNKMAEDLTLHQARVIEQERLQKEIEMCRRIQEEMLPREPLKVPCAEAKGVSLPARQVGGDFFNYFLLPDGEIAVLVGDVSGKGVPAALLMANFQATLQARLQTERDLARLARDLDMEISRQTEPQTFVTLFMSIIGQDGKTIRWVNAGHNPQFLLREDGAITALESTGRPLGLLPGSEFEEGQTELRGGDSLFLYTDGLVEATNAAGEEFGTERLAAILVNERAGRVDKVIADLVEAVTLHREGQEAGDDATMLALRIS